MSRGTSIALHPLYAFMVGEGQIYLSQGKNTSQLWNVINLGDVDICAASRKMYIYFNRNDKT
jgi:hypothetical protein